MLARKVKYFTLISYQVLEITLDLVYKNKNNNTLKSS